MRIRTSTIALGGLACLAAVTSATTIPEFRTATVVPQFFSPLFTKTVDFDGDQDPDVIAVTDFGPIVWFENDPSTTPPTFTEHTIALASEVMNPRTAHPVDFDNDGDLDIVVAQGGFTGILLFETTVNPDGSRTFERSVLVQGTGGALEVQPFDMDGDGDTDLLFNSFEVFNVVIDLGWYENLGGDPPQFQLRVINDGIYNEDVKLVPVDLDQDGDMDFIGGTAATSARCNPNVSTMVWYRNDGNSPPSFTPRTFPNSTCTISPLVGDLDNDGDLDVVGISENIELFINNGAPDPLFSFVLLDMPNEFLNGVAIDGALGDIDGNGALDILLDLDVPSDAGPQQSGFSTVWLQNVDQLFPDFRPFLFPGVVQMASGIESADFDNDGDDDVIVVSELGNSLSYIDNRLLSCPGNCDGSPNIDFGDLVCTLFQFGDTTATGSVDCNMDGTVDFGDLTCVLFGFGPCDG